MADRTGIEWTDATWSPTLGCTKVSPGCDNCYAMRTVHRMSFNPNEKVSSAAEGLTAYRPGVGPVWTNLVRELPDRLDLPLRWRKPRRIFVDSQSDLFHERVSDEFIARVFAVMSAAAQHTFQVLTKRHGRMRSLLSDDSFVAAVRRARFAFPHTAVTDTPAWPLPNVWLGVSVENQKWADIRIPALLDTPAAVRFLSCEPLLGPVGLSTWLPCPRPAGACGDMSGGCCECAHPANGPGANRSPDWVIVGGESGRGARPMLAGWARLLRDQCVAAGIPFHFKQWGESAPLDQLPPDALTSWEIRNGPGYPGLTLCRVGKKAAGRELDGLTWDEFPEVDR